MDADTALSFQNIQFQRDSAQLLDGVTAAQIAEIAGTSRIIVGGDRGGRGKTGCEFTLRST